MSQITEPRDTGGHTAGPWAVSQNTNFVFGRKQGNGLEPVGFIYGPSFAEDSEVGRRALADTRLCAAAPELLDALQVLYVAYCGVMRSEFDFPGRPWTPERDNDIDALQARAAIAKATGSQS